MKSQNTRSANTKSYVRNVPPSQMKKMVPATFAGKVLALKANKDLFVVGVRIASGEKFYLVQCDRFPGYAYVVTWNDVRAQYVCSCGNPVCTAHTGPAMEYAALDAVRVVTVAVAHDTQAEAREMLAGMQSSVGNVVARIMAHAFDEQVAC